MAQTELPLHFADVHRVFTPYRLPLLGNSQRKKSLLQGMMCMPVRLWCRTPGNTTRRTSRLGRSRGVSSRATFLCLCPSFPLIERTLSGSSSQRASPTLASSR
jgi:hypothetical protein